MIRKTAKRKLLSDKITDILSVQPSADIEDDHVFGSKPKTVTRDDLVTSDNEEAALSIFRKQTVDLLSDISKKYEGEVSQRDLALDDSDLDGLDDEDSDEGTKLIDSASEDSDVEEKSSDGSEDLDSNNSGAKSDEEFNLSHVNTDRDGAFVHMSNENVSKEINKGNCVRNQLLMWENLLEMRINFQKCLIAANRMPMSETLKRLRLEGGEVFRKNVSTTENCLKTLADKLLDLQENLLKNYPETKNLATKSGGESNKGGDNGMRDEDDEEIPSDTEAENSDEDRMEATVEPAKSVLQNKCKKRKLVEYSEELAKRHAQYKSYRDAVIQKWNDKTRLAVANSKSVPSNPILSQINYILSDKRRLIKRTQLKRSDYKIVGYMKPVITTKDDVNGFKDNKDQDEYIPNIFDDDDFYHQLLRELIECKTADISDPIQLGRQWVALQQMRSKMKRKVDTKATKGRKIKYVLHPKLVNFMAPEKTITWTDDSKTELFKSLFGKVFEEDSLLTDNVTLKDGLKLISN